MQLIQSQWGGRNEIDEQSNKLFTLVIAGSILAGFSYNHVRFGDPEAHIPMLTSIWFVISAGLAVAVRFRLHSSIASKRSETKIVSQYLDRFTRISAAFFACGILGILVDIMHTVKGVENELLHGSVVGSIIVFGLVCFMIMRSKFNQEIARARKNE